jgi:3-hydroxyisobutyrate dehydrogenase-like beta-hydroxyacid dehydrogenase
MLLVVVDDQQVEDIALGAGGVIAAAAPGSVIAICASVRPETCVKVSDAAKRSDVHVIDVALVGGERAAEQGGLTLFCGGDVEVIQDCTPAFSAFATNVCHVGATGAGQVAKTVNNILMWTNVRADVEALRLARSWGILPTQLRSVLLTGTGGNRVLADWGLHRLRWPQKDLDAALGLADALDVDVPFVRALKPLMEQLTREDLDDLR